MASELHLRVVTPDRTVLDRKVKAVSFMGIDGSYGILPNHAPLMTATMPGIVKVTNGDGSVEELLVTDGFAEMRNNVLSLICEAGERAADIDLERAREAEARARKKIEEAHKVDINLAQAEASLQKALLRQSLARKGSGTGTIHP
jgi:F-type H+-transporting ATPase subunit epsilon